MKCHLEISQGRKAEESFSSAVRLRVQRCLNANVGNETRVCNDAIFYLLSNKGDGFRGLNRVDNQHPILAPLFFLFFLFSEVN